MGRFIKRHIIAYNEFLSRPGLGISRRGLSISR